MSPHLVQGRYNQEANRYTQIQTDTAKKHTDTNRYSEEAQRYKQIQTDTEGEQEDTHREANRYKQIQRRSKQIQTDAKNENSDLGPYGRVFKPRLNASDSDLGSGAEAGRGEWNYSDIVTIPAATDMSSTDAIERRDLADQYTISLLGSTTTEDVGDETRKYSNVGMIESWLGSRK
eukprot:gene674-2292_t